MQEVTYMGDDAELYMEMQEPGFWDWVERYNSKYEYDEDDEFEDEEEVVFKRYFLVDYENVNPDEYLMLTTPKGLWVPDSLKNNLKH